MSLFATEKLPSPVVVVGVVDHDLASRTLSVRPSELASGYERLNWRTAHQSLVQSQEGGWRTAQTVYASAPGAYHVAHVGPGAVPVAGGSFPFRCGGVSAVDW
jgi:hypothetical protein